MTDSPHTPRRTRWIAELRSLAGLLLLVVGFHSLAAKPFYIPSESMMPGLLVGDRLLVSKYPYGWSYASASFHLLPFIQGRLLGRLPERGDVVIVSPPGRPGRDDLIKRVVGLPGDRVQMVRGRLWLNGRPVPTLHLGYRTFRTDSNLRCPAGDRGRLSCRFHVLRETLPGGRSYDVLDLHPGDQDDTAPYQVPAGRVFLMGDNRDNSADSRSPLASGGLGGAVPVEAVGGRAEFVTFSLKGEASWNPATWFSNFRTDRSGASLRPEPR
ncbi:MAG TPA: signal peptidase I [Allosphingosinicella sp.]|jgi:signal peptidase I